MARPRPDGAPRESGGRAAPLALLLAALAGVVAAGWAMGAAISAVVPGGEPLLEGQPVVGALSDLRAGWLTATMHVVSALGSIWVLGPVVAVTALALRRRRADGPRQAGLLVAALGGAVVVTYAVKALVGRPRPELDPLVAVAADHAFPSGHATQAAAVWGALALVAAARWPARRGPVGVAAIILVAAIGASRLYLGVHWTIDVLGGWLLGVAWLAIVVAGQRREARPAP